MQLNQEILQWSKGLPLWQRDALRRIWEKRDLDKIEKNDVLDLLKKEYGLLTINNLKAIPLCEDNIMPLNVMKKFRVLKSLKILNGVNALENNQKIDFIESGVNIIYGENASGKSGYAKVLKKICNSRDSDIKILPNINDSINIKDKATVLIETVVKEKPPQEYVWIDGDQNSIKLKDISVFDSECARAYIDSENEVFYIPFGLMALSMLGQLCDELKYLIEKEKQNLPQQPEQINEIVKSDGLIKTISYKTNINDIKRLYSFTDEDKNQKNKIEKLLNDIKANNIEEKIKSYNRFKSRVDEFRKFLLLIKKQLSSVKIRQLFKAKQLLLELASANKEMFKDEFKHEHLKGIGSSVWREMFISAEKYSTMQAYKGSDFPYTGDNSRCVLCQQLLDEDSKHRLKKFWAFIKEDIATKEKSAQLRCQVLLQELIDLKEFISSYDKMLLTEIDDYIPGAIAKIETFLKQLKSYDALIISSYENDEHNEPQKASSFKIPILSSLSKKLSNDIIDFSELLKPEEQESLTKKFNILQEKYKISQNIDIISTYINNLTKEYLLNKCSKACSTRSITIKHSELTDAVLMTDLENNLKSELKHLYVDYLNVRLVPSRSKAKAYHRLDFETNHSIKPSQILSEGEHRVISIASFLAELKTSQINNSIVFDDPVCSLDHVWRERIAKRIVMEAKKRQVIIFTHDIVFLFSLQDEAKEQNVQININWLRRLRKRIGITANDTPWIAKQSAECIGKIKNQYQTLAKLYRTNSIVEYENGVIDCYGYMRDTWERIVEDILLNKTIIRFRDSVQTQRLKRVLIDDDDYKKVESGMKRCSRFIRGHNKSIAMNNPIPIPEELLQDIKDIEDFRKTIIKKQDTTEKSRN